MYTSCPSCNAVFNISEDQLHIAGGKVKCGRCSTVFDGNATLSEELPANMVPVAKKREATADATEEGMDFDLPDVGGDDSAESADLGYDQGFDLDSGEIEEVSKNDFAADTVFTPETDDLSGGNDLNFDLDSGDSHYGALDESIFMNDVDNDNDESGLRAAGEKKSIAEMELEGSQQAAPDLSYEFERDGDISESFASEELDTRTRSSSLSVVGILGWSVLVLVLLFALIAQFAYFKRAALMKYEWAVPALEQMCAIVGQFATCDLPEPRELTSIKLIEKDVRAHPKTKGALLVTATIRNDAGFSQPYPKLEINFFDAEGLTVASRLFEPKEYLSPEADIEKGMTKSVPSRIILEIVDPGENALNFEINFR